MKKMILMVFSFLLCHGMAGAGQEVMVVQSLSIKPYEATLEGFKSVCRCRHQRVVLSESPDRDVLKEIRRFRPPVILAIGRDALQRVKGIKRTPIVYVMVLNPRAVLSGAGNITGVGLSVPPDRQLDALLDAVPGIRSIGLLYDPERTGYLVREARHAALRKGLSLLTRKIRAAGEAPSLIMGLKGKIDAFWMLPDITVMTPETLEFLLLFSMENKVPLLAFSEKYLELGAFMSTGIEAFDMGRQAGEIANGILSGKSKHPIPQRHARKIVVSTNLMIAGKLGIKLNLASTAGMDEKIVRHALTMN